MLTKFDPDFNAEIRRIVNNFNRKRNRGIKRGFKFLPRKVYVSDIKEQFQTKGEIEKYLKQLENFNIMKDSAFSEIVTEGGAKTSLYNMNFVRDNLTQTKDFYDRQIEEAKRLFENDRFSIAKREYLFNLEEKRKELELNINQLTQSQFNAFEKYTNQMLNENRSKLIAYKGFLSVIDETMKITGVDKQTRNKLFEKLSTLSPAEFVKMYRNNDLINRIYDIIPSPPIGPNVMTTGDDDAKALINELLVNFDIIKEESMKI